MPPSPRSTRFPYTTLFRSSGGAHVICEKPFVASLDEADRVMAAAEAAGKRIALNHEFREMPIFRALRDAAAPSDIVFAQVRSEEHTSELQSLRHLVCRLLL